MAKLPSFQFYPGDWVKDPNLSRATKSEKGFLMDLLCLMFECDERGIIATVGVTWQDEEIAGAICGDKMENLSCLQGLLRKGVLQRNNSGAIYSRRMVRDEEIRKMRQEAGHLGGQTSVSNKQNGSKSKAKLKQNRTPSSSSSVSSSNAKTKKDLPPSAAPPTSSKFTKPTAEQVEEYAQTIDYKLNGAAFCAHYQSKGWKIGNSPMKDWRSAVVTWKIRDGKEKPQDAPKTNPFAAEEAKREREDKAQKARSEQFDRDLRAARALPEFPEIEAEAKKIVPPSPFGIGSLMLDAKIVEVYRERITKEKQ